MEVTAIALIVLLAILLYLKWREASDYRALYNGSTKLSHALTRELYSCRKLVHTLEQLGQEMRHIISLHELRHEWDVKLIEGLKNDRLLASEGFGASVCPFSGLDTHKLGR